MATVDPGIETPLDGIWWAWVTVTTVGYGDIVPVTTIGRIFAGFLILLGIALFSMLTASFSAFFLSESENKLTAKEIENSQKLEKLQEKISSLEGKIDELLAKK